MRHAPELATAVAVGMLFGGCTSPAKPPVRHTQTAVPQPTPSPTLTRGRNNTHSDLQYEGTNVPYLLAVNCEDGSNGDYTEVIPGPVRAQSVSEAVTVGATAEIGRSPTPPSPRDRINFLAGLTLRQVGGGAIEFARSDDPPGSTTTLVGPGDAEYIAIPGQNYELMVYVDAGSANYAGSIGVSCISTEIKPPGPTDIPTPFPVSTPGRTVNI